MIVFSTMLYITRRNHEPFPLQNMKEFYILKVHRFSINLNTINFIRQIDIHTYFFLLSKKGISST